MDPTPISPRMASIKSRVHIDPAPLRTPPGALSSNVILTRPRPTDNPNPDSEAQTQKVRGRADGFAQDVVQPELGAWPLRPSAQASLHPCVSEPGPGRRSPASHRAMGSTLSVFHLTLGPKITIQVPEMMEVCGPDD